MTARRTLLRFTAATVAARTDLPLAARAEEAPHGGALSAHPDAALIAMADRYPAALAEFNGYHGPEGDPRDDAMRAEVYGTFEHMLDARPTTLEGLAAKARVALADAMADGEEMPADQTADQLARSIVHDLLRLAGGAA